MTPASPGCFAGWKSCTESVHDAMQHAFMTLVQLLPGDKQAEMIASPCADLATSIDKANRTGLRCTFYFKWWLVYMCWAHSWSVMYTEEKYPHLHTYTVIRPPRRLPKLQLADTHTVLLHNGGSWNACTMKRCITFRSIIKQTMSRIH